MTRSREDPTTRNIAAVAKLEHSERLRRTAIERVIDRVGSWAGHASFPLLHVAWFAVWIGFNLWSEDPFDPYPFIFLMLVVSLEAITILRTPSFAAASITL